MGIMEVIVFNEMTRRDAAVIQRLKDIRMVPTAAVIPGQMSHLVGGNVVIAAVQLDDPLRRIDVLEEIVRQLGIGG